MFPLSLLQSSHSPFCVYREPSLTLWPTASQLIYGQLEDDMRNMRSDLERRMHRVNQAFQLLDMDKRRAAQSRRVEGESSSVKKEGNENYELTLDVGGFSPEELTVKTEGRRLIVSGKHDNKKTDEYGGFFHEYREWRREAELLEDVNPEDVLCSLSKDGRLHFQAPCVVTRGNGYGNVSVTWLEWWLRCIPSHSPFLYSSGYPGAVCRERRPHKVRITRKILLLR